MDSTKTDIFAMDNSTTTTPRVDTESTPMRDFLLGRSERMETMQAQKQQQKAEWEMITKANGFGQTKVENNRDDKNLRKNYLQSLDYNDQKTFIELYNKNKDLSFGDVVKKLEDTSETARGGGYRAQINAQNERDAIDYANAIGLGTENLDNRVNENVQGYSTDSRKQALREKVDNLPIEQQMEYVNKYNNDETMQYLYKNAYEMALHQNASLLDNMLDTWEEEDVGPNFGVMMANIPQSTLKLFTASLRGVTNPADTLVGLGKLFATEEGRQMLADRYLSRDGIKQAMEEDPVGLASDIMSFTGNVAKRGAGGTTRLVGKATKNPLTSQIGKGIYKVGDAIDDASDFGTSKITSEFLSNKAKELQASTSRISRGAGKYLELTQHPLQSIRKGGSKFLRGGFNADNSTSNPESFVGRMKERIGNNFNPSGFSREERTRMQNNPYFQEEYNRAKSMVENSGMPVDPQRITEEGFQKIGDELKQKIETYENNLNANGKLYENLRNNPTRYNLTDGLNAIKQFFRENGITIVGDDLIFKHGTKEENAKIKEAWDMIQKNALHQTDFKNYHRVRQDIDNIAKYTEGPAVKKYQSVRKMRELLDDVAKREIPGLKKVDEVYKREIDELNKIKEGLVYKDNKKIGEWRDNFYSIMRTLNKQNRQTMKGRLEEQIFPGIAERVEAVDLASKAMKAYQDSPALMKVFGKMLGVSTGGLTAGLSVILGAILDEAVFKPLGEKMRKKALDQIASEMSPEAQQKLVDIEAKLKMGIELKEADKLVLDEARKEIEEAVKQFNDEEEQAKIKQEEKRKQVEAQRKEQEVQEAKQKEEFDSFLNDMEKEAPKIEKEEVNYKDLSDETLNELRDDETLPQAERDIIEKELFSRAQFDEAIYDAEHERTPVYNMTRTDYIRKIKKLQEEEQRIGKVGKNTVNKDYADKQRKTRETKKERIIEMLGEDYGLEKDQAYDKFLELENAGVEEEGYSQRGGTKNRDKTKEQPILDQLSKKREIRNKQPAFLKSFKQDALDTREFYHTLLDGYEIQPVDKGDRIVKNGETVGNITYKENGTIDSVIVKDLDNFINQKKLLQDLPSDTMIKTAGDKYGMTAGEMREQLGMKEPKYQRAYHGGPNSFDRFDLSHLGEGEGAQAHGRGHYVALSEDVARGYAEKGSTGYYKYKGDDLGFDPDDMEMVNGEGKMAYYMVNDLEHGKSFDEAKKENMEWLESEMEDADDEYIYELEEMKNALENMKESDFSKTSRNFYEIEIPDEKKTNTPTGTNYLDERKEFTKEEKQKMYEALSKYPELESQDYYKAISEDNLAIDPAGLYETMKRDVGAQRTSEILHEIGYDGIKYDGGTDGPCAVIFTDEAMQITRHEQYQKSGRAKQYEKDIKAQEGLSIENFKNGRTVEQIAKDYGIETNIVDRIATPEGEKALGMYADGLITLAKDIKESTAPHELLHATFDLVDAKRKQKILDTVKKKLEREGKTDDPEEWLADNFSEYFRTGKFEERGRPTGIKNKIVEFFKRVKDFITGVWSERKTIKNLFDDIIENRIEHDMVNDLLKNEDGYSGAQRLNLYQTSSGRKLNIGNENSSHFVKKLYQFKEQIENGEITKDNFLDELQNIFREDGKDGQYTKINTGNGSHNLRIADHYANTHNQITHKKRNLGIVIKDLSNPLRPDGLTKDRFLNNDKDKISFNEYVYDKRNLTPEKMNEIVDGIRELIQTGHYTTNLTDLVHRTKLAPERYQIAPMQKSLFDDDLKTEPKVEEQPKETKKEKTPKAPKKLTKKQIDDFKKEYNNAEIYKDTSFNPADYDLERYDEIRPTAKKEIPYDKMMKLKQNLKDTFGTTEELMKHKDEFIKTEINDDGTPYKNTSDVIHFRNMNALLDGGKSLEEINEHLYDEELEQRGHQLKEVGPEGTKKLKDMLYQMGEQYDNDIDTWRDNTEELRKKYGKKNPRFRDGFTKSDMLDYQNFIKKQGDLKDYDKQYIQDNGQFDDFYMTHLVRGYLQNKAGQDIKDRVQKLYAISMTSLENLDKTIKDFGGKTPMPSIAVTNPLINSANFGDIAYIFKKETVDPKANENNRIYGSDAYTPMFPELEPNLNKRTPIKPMKGDWREMVQTFIPFADENDILKESTKIKDGWNGILNQEQNLPLNEVAEKIVEGMIERHPEWEKGNIKRLKDSIFYSLQELIHTNKQIRGDQFLDKQPREITPENVLKAMQETQEEAKRTSREGSFKDVINIIGTKSDDLEKTRKKNFANIGAHSELSELTEPLQRKYDDYVEQIIERMDQNSTDSTEPSKYVRKDLRDAFNKSYDGKVETLKKNLEEIRPEYKDIDDNLYKAIINVVEDGRNLPVRYSEAKPNRIVDLYNEVQYLLVPEDKEDIVSSIVAGTPLEDKIHPYKDGQIQGDIQGSYSDKGVSDKLAELQKKYGNVFFSIGGMILPIAYLLQMMNGGEEQEGQEV